MLASRGSADYLVGMTVSTSATNLAAIVETQSVGLRLWLLAGLVCLSSLLFGYSVGVLNVCTASKDPMYQGSLQRDVPLTGDQVGNLNAMVPIGAIIGSAIAGYFSEQFGRKKTLLTTSLIFIIGSLFNLKFAWKYELILIGRGIVGLAVGVESAVAPVLLTEMSPSNVRGRVTTLHQLAITVGILIAALVGFALVPRLDHGWMYCLLLTALPAAIQIVFSFALPESPRWLVRQGRRSDAKATMQFISPNRSVREIDNELAQMDVGLQQEANMKTAGWKETFSYKRGIPMYVVSSAIVSPISNLFFS